MFFLTASQLPFIANTCNGTHNISNAAVVSPASNGQTGDPFSVNCSSGYTASPAATGNMTCDPNNNWMNKVLCIGKYVQNFAKHIRKNKIKDNLPTT